MTILDLIALAFMGIFLLRGFFKGFISQITSLAIIVIGFYLSYKFSSVFADFLYTTFSIKMESAIYSFILLFIVVLISGSLFSRVLTKVVNLSGLGLLNKSCGAVIGVVKSAMLLSFILKFIVLLNKNYPLFDTSIIERMYLYSFFKSVSSYIFPYIEGFLSGLSNVV